VLTARWQQWLLALVAGALLPLAFAPLALWPLALLSLALLFWLWQRVPGRSAAMIGFIYGLGLFGVGVSWVYVAIHEFGHSPPPLAALLTLLFVAFLALFPALAGYLMRRWPLSPALQLLLAAPLAWLVSELLRGWLLSGFPWLLLGYVTLDTPLAGLAPWIGIHGQSLLVALTAAALLWLAQQWRQWRRASMVAVLLILLCWPLASLLSLRATAEPLSAPLRVALVQGSVDQQTKWQASTLRQRLETYTELTLPHLGQVDLIVWPENAITTFYHRLRADWLDPLARSAAAKGSEIVIGIPVQDSDGERYYTSAVNLNSGHLYHKRHLVPFGEFMPLERWLRGLIALFDLPMSSFSAGPQQQPPFIAAGRRMAVTICYEDIFPWEYRHELANAELLLNLSNNGWYGDSLAPHQHLQIARMRSLESGLPQIRATTSGISAVIDGRGAIIVQSAQFVPATLTATLTERWRR
jgi:apolipoprotein N-acyltransferase